MLLHARASLGMSARNRFVAALAAALCTPAIDIAAQSTQAVRTPALITLRGTTFDSLTGRSLAGATVRLVGRMETKVSDENGMFHFDSVAYGDYMLVMEHPRLDSLGLSEVGTRATMSPERHDVTMSVPSFATLWRGACGAQKSPSDSGLLYGAVRDADSRTAMSNARVLVSWVDFGLDKNKLQQVRYTHETRSAEDGTYVACGVPLDIALQISAYVDAPGAATDSAAMFFDLPARAIRVQRRDLLVATNTAGRAALRGSVGGRITNESGVGFADVRVLLDGAEVMRTDSTGQYAFNNARVGTHSIEFIAPGREPVSRTIDVTPGNTVLLGARLDRVAAAAIQEGMREDVRDMILSKFKVRRAKYRYNIMDSTKLGRFTAMSEMFGGKNGWKCEVNLFIDNVLVTQSQFMSLIPSSLAWMESYSARDVPLDFDGPGECGSFVVFTKRAIMK